MKNNHFGINQRAFGLIEILIALLILAGTSLLISQMIPRQQHDIFLTTDRAECQNRVQNIISSIKKYDNQILAYSWLPGNGRVDNLDPHLSTNIPWATTRITKNLMGNFSTPVYTTGQILIPESQIKKIDYTILQPNHTYGLEDALLSDYATTELDIVQYGNLWQLSQNAAALLYADYSKQCNGGTIDSSTGFLGTVVGTHQLDSENVSFKIDRIDLKTGNLLPCANWEPLPLNSNPTNLFSAAARPLTSINQAIGYKVTATLTYLAHDSSQRLGCEANTSVSPGAYFNQPITGTGRTRLESNLKVQKIGTFLPNSSITCDPGINTLGWRIGPACGPKGCEPGIAYLCRFDYMGKKPSDPPNNPAAATFPLRSTGWFICSLPPAGLDARSNGILTTLTATNTIDVSGGTPMNSTQLMMGGSVYEGQYRLHVMGIDHARNVAVVAKNIFIDTNPPAIVSLDPPREIHPMGEIIGYGHMGRQDISNAATIGGSPSINSPWTQLKDVFNKIVAPHQNLFQCQAQTGSGWSVSSGPGNPNDLNIAPNDMYGISYGPANASLTATCGSVQSYYALPALGYKINNSGEYKIRGIACDACRHQGSWAETLWYVDLLMAPQPTTCYNQLNRGQGTTPAGLDDMSFRCRSMSQIGTVPANTDLSIAHSCEIYNEPLPKWSANLADHFGRSTCYQSEWENTIGDSCTSDPAIGNDQCIIAIDGCARYAKRGFDTNYQVHGGTIPVPPSRDCCSAPGTSPACANINSVAQNNFYCSDGTATAGSPFCTSATELKWTGTRNASAAYALPVCNDGDINCKCWTTSECTNTLTSAARTACGNSGSANCEGPYTGPTCPAGFIMDYTSLQNAKSLFKNDAAHQIPPAGMEQGKPCVVPQPVVCILDSASWVNPGPTPIPANSLAGHIDYGFANCAAPTDNPLNIPGCFTNRCPLMVNACEVAPATPTPTPATCTSPKESCIAGDPRWANCTGTPLCGDPVCAGDPANYQWTTPAFDPAALNACAATSSVTPASCLPPNIFSTSLQTVSRVAPGVRCMNGATPANPICCSGQRPAAQTFCNLNTCNNACGPGAHWEYQAWAACDPPTPPPGECDGYGPAQCCVFPPDNEVRPGVCKNAGGGVIADSCCGTRESRSCGCLAWLCNFGGPLNMGRLCK